MAVDTLELKRFDDMVETSPFTSNWNVDVSSKHGITSTQCKGALQLRSYLSWLNLQRLDSIILSKDSNIKDVNQLIVKSTFFQLLVVLFDKTVHLLCVNHLNDFFRIRSFACTR